MPGSDDGQGNNPLPPELTDDKIRELLAAGEGKRPERRLPSSPPASSKTKSQAGLSDAGIKVMLAAGERSSRAATSSSRPVSYRGVGTPGANRSERGPAPAPQISPDMNAAQIRALLAAGSGGRSLSRRTDFDDSSSLMWSILKRYGFPAIIFLAVVGFLTSRVHVATASVEIANNSGVPLHDVTLIGASQVVPAGEMEIRGTRVVSMKPTDTLKIQFADSAPHSVDIGTAVSAGSHVHLDVANGTVTVRP